MILEGKEAYEFLLEMNKPLTKEEIKMFEDIEKKDYPKIL